MFFFFFLKKGMGIMEEFNTRNKDNIWVLLETQLGLNWGWTVKDQE